MLICIAPRRERTSKALRYGTRSQGISQFNLHTPRLSANGMNHTCPFRSRSLERLRGVITTRRYPKKTTFTFTFRAYLSHDLISEKLVPVSKRK